MKIEGATAKDIRTVAIRMRDRDFAEFSAVTKADTRPELAALLVSRYAGRSEILCGSKGGDPICIGGTLETRPNVMTLLFFATDRFPEIAIPITRFTRQLFDRFERIGIHRIEAVSLDDYTQMHRWLRTLGLRQETGPMQGYGKGGEAFIQFARVRDVRSSGA